MSQRLALRRVRSRQQDHVFSDRALLGELVIATAMLIEQLEDIQDMLAGPQCDCPECSPRPAPKSKGWN